MDVIVPFVENLYYEEGKFIKPDGTILYSGKNHALYARSYCEQAVMNSKLVEKSDEILTEKEIEILKLWEEQYAKISCKGMEFLYSDFLTYVLGWDKVCSDRTIITIDQHPHYRLYNYYLDGWKFEFANPYRIKNGEFVIGFDPNMSFESEYGKEREYEQKGEQILKLVKPKDVHLYFE